MRGIVGSPGSLTALISLGLAAGPATGVYVASEHLLNQRLPGIQRPEEVFELAQYEAARADRALFGFSMSQYEALQRVQQGFQELAAFAKLGRVVSDAKHASVEVVEYVSGNYFPMLGARAHVGRLIGPEHDHEAAEPVAVVSYRYWMETLGGNPDVVGEVIRINSASTRVIGVAAREFEGLRMDWNGPTSVWVPAFAAPRLGDDPLLRVQTFIRVLGRLRGSANAATLDERATRWLDAIPPTVSTVVNPDRIAVTPAVVTRIGRRVAAQRFLAPLFAICVLTFLAAAFNVANLFLGRSLSRERDVTIRAALGATRLRLFTHALSEVVLFSLLAALVAGASALLVEQWLEPLVPHFLGVIQPVEPLTFEGSHRGLVLVLPLVASALVAAAFGLLPFGRALRTSAAGALRLRAQGLDRPTWSLRRGALALQAALAVVLVGCGVMLFRSVPSLTDENAPFADPSAVGFARVNLPRARLDELGSFNTALLERIRRRPGVVSASIGATPPLTGAIGVVALPDGGAPVDVNHTAVSPGYFRTVGLAVVRGRELDPGEGDRYAVVNEVLAEALWPGLDPIGRRLILNEGEPREVIGVVAIPNCSDPFAPPHPCVWQGSAPNAGGYVTIRVRGDVTSELEATAELVRGLDPDAALSNVHRLDDFLHDRAAPGVAATRAAAVLSGIALALLVAGCWSLFRAMILSDLPGLAVRFAIGATNARIVAEKMAQAALIASTGALVGAVVLTALAPRFFATTMRTGLSAGLVVTTAAAVVLLALVTVVWACLRTTRRIDLTRYLNV